MTLRCIAGLETFAALLDAASAPLWPQADLVNLQYIRTERSGKLLVGNSDHHHPEYADPDRYVDKADDAIDGLYLCAGFSGHGFKISRAVGMLVAEVVCGGTELDEDIPASDFALSRFEEDRPLRSEHPYRMAGQMR